MKRRKQAVTAPPAVSETSPQHIALSGWKLALFAVITVVGFFALLEGALAWIGVRPSLVAEDPYVGFASNIPLFIEEQGDDGQVYMETAPNKIRWFNEQRFAKDKPPHTYRVFAVGGSTTYGRPYDDKGSFSAWLREVLDVAAPGRQWEVINAGGVSYASYRVAVVMEELVQYQPDLFVIYSGHNEFLEKRTYSGIVSAPRLLTETGGLLSRTRIYTAVGKLLQTGRDERPPRGAVLDAEVDTILEHSVGPSQYTRDEEWRADVIEHYRFNLNRMVDIARASGAEVIFVVPAADLRMTSPFKSEHRDGLSAQDRERFRQLLADAAQARRNQDATTALELVDAALALDDRYAEAAYERGRVLYDLGRFDEAKVFFQRALDEDICPLRILIPMQEAVREIAAEHGVPLVDFQSVIESRSPYGIPGPEYFLDHVHLNLEGYRLLALRLLDELVEQRIATLSPNWGDEALAGVIRTVEGRIDEREQAIALRNLAKVLDWAGKQEEAARLAEQAAVTLGDDAESLNVLGRAAMSRGEIEKAVEYFERSLEARPGYLEPLTSLGIALGELGRSDEAMACFRAAIDAKPDFAEAHYNLGSALMAAGEADEAIASYRKALVHDPENAPTHNNLGVALASLGRLDEAVESYRRALDLQPNYAEAILNLGLALQAKGDPEAGLALLEKVLDQEPDSPEALVNVANAMLAAGQVDQATALYRRAADLEPDSSVVLYNLGNALLEAGRAEEAMEPYRKAIQLAPSSPEIRSNLGRALLETRRPEEAARQYRIALERLPDSAQARFNLATALTEAKRFSEAEQFYQEAIRMRPDYAEAYTNLGNLLLDRNRVDEAIRSYRRAIELRPAFVDAHYNLGMALGLNGQAEEAVREFQKTVELRPDYAEAHHYLATSLDLAGRLREAVKHLEIAARLRPDWPAPLNQWAWILATKLVGEPGAASRAIELARSATELTGRRDPTALDALAAAYAASGQFDLAEKTAAEAVGLFRRAGAEAEARAAERRLAAYRRGEIGEPKSF